MHCKAGTLFRFLLLTVMHKRENDTDSFFMDGY